MNIIDIPAPGPAMSLGYLCENFHQQSTVLSFIQGWTLGSLMVLVLVFMVLHLVFQTLNFLRIGGRGRKRIRSGKDSINSKLCITFKVL